MAKQKKKIYIAAIILLFVSYFFIAARPIPNETVLSCRWISALTDSGEINSFSFNEAENLLPFILGNRFGFVDKSGQFAVNRINYNNVYLGKNSWAEYESEPANIEIKNISGDLINNIDNPGGYPVLLDNRIFIFGSEQNSLSEIGSDGNVLWAYEFGAPLTCIDAASGLLLTGSLDGAVEIINSEGRRVYYFEPGGSQYDVILGCAISDNGSRLGIICGINPQRFLLLERLGANGEYRIVHHEFLEDSFRRPVHISFIDEDRRIVYERAGGIGSYNISSRRGIFIPLKGNITVMDNSGADGLLFMIASHSNNQNELIGIKFPQERRFLSGLFYSQDPVFIKASFKSDDVFLGRNGSMLVAGGGTALISFNLEDN